MVGYKCPLTNDCEVSSEKTVHNLTPYNLVIHDPIEVPFGLR